MMDTFIPLDELQWQTVQIHRQGETRNYDYELELFKPLADWDVWDYWERERIDSMQKHIKQGDVLFDVGVEQGWMSALFSKYMTSQVVLIEPTKEFWPGIKAIFERNNLKDPIYSFCGFFSDKDDPENKDVSPWPSDALNDDVIEKRKYRNIYDEADQKVVSSMRIDTFVSDIEVIPDHISIDVEGAELLVLRGAEQTLKKHKPLVWCSVHPDMMRDLYDYTEAELLFFMEDCCYEMELLAVDHEKHWFFWPKKDKNGL